MTIDLHNKDSEADFHALTKGLFIAAHANEYLSLWRRMLIHKSWGSKVKNYAIVEGKVILEHTQQTPIGGLKDIIQKSIDSELDYSYGCVKTYFYTASVVEIPADMGGHSDTEKGCAIPAILASLLRSAVEDRLKKERDDYLIRSIEVDLDSITCVCSSSRHV